MLIFVDADFGDLRRRKRANDELHFVVVPRNNVDPLAVQFCGDDLHARAANPHASSHRIDARIVRFDRDFGAVARIAHGVDDFQNALFDLRHHAPKQFRQKARMLASQANVRPAPFRVDFFDERLHAIADFQHLARQHILFGEQALDARDIDDGVAARAIDPLDIAAQHFLAAREQLGFEHFALRLAQALVEILLRALHRGALGKIGIGQRFFDELAGLDFGRQALLLAHLVRGFHHHLGLRIRHQLLLLQHAPAAKRAQIAAVGVDLDPKIGVAKLGRALAQRNPQGLGDNLQNRMGFDFFLARERKREIQNVAAFRPRRVALRHSVRRFVLHVAFSVIRPVRRAPLAAP